MSSDDLRTRIAAAIMQTCHGVYMDDAVDAADAVIRFVTDWITSRRDRIAAVIADRIVNDGGVMLRRHGEGNSVQLVVDTMGMADAVICELRLSDGDDLTCDQTDSTGSIGQSAESDHAYPRDYTDRQLWESVWRKIDGLAAMVAGPTRMYPDADPDDIADVVAAWTPNPTHNEENR